MNIEKLKTAIYEAERFIEKSASLIKRKHEAPTRIIGTHNFTFDPFTGCKESGAVKRASMDLSNALAELRKPQ